MTARTRTFGAICASTAAATTVLAGLAGLAGPPAVAAERVDIVPTQLSRGADVAGPHLRGGDVVDGDRRVEVPGRSPVLLGASGSGYVVVSLARQTWTTYRVGMGAPTVVVSGPIPEEVVLADDGKKVAVTRSSRRTRTVVDVLSVGTGERVRRGTFAGYPRVLDVEGNRAVVGGPDGGVRWNLRTGGTRVIDTGFVYLADLSSNRMASFDKDPYEGGCSTVSQITSPRELLWVSCREAVRAFSPDGQRIVTQHKLTDGIGPSKLWERTVEGRLLATYTVGSNFGDVTWESNRTVLLEAYTSTRGAVVRCSVGACERASKIRPNPYA